MSFIKRIFQLNKLITKKKEKLNNQDKNYIEKQLFINDSPKDFTIYHLKTFKQKYENLIFKHISKENIAYVIRNINGFNTLGFIEPIDVIVCNQKNEIVSTYTKFLPQKFTKHYTGFNFFYIFPTGILKRFDLRIGDIIRTK
ncbi:hypothetical protein [Spiroplasma endosymbiont of Labia minor]|uniref:hypothetical protein n=1 Tax=Spiroplasma endosymbiont of Labia minor TaxID=3066305 RepID=UPI0030D49A98